MPRRSVASSAAYDSRNEIKLLSAQSLLKLTDRLGVLAGTSISDSQQTSGLVDSRVTLKFDRQTSLRGGLTYELGERSNAYVSYSESFIPQAQTDAEGHLLVPLEGVQWEAGIKSRRLNGALLLTAAAYRVEEKNSPIYIGYDPIIGDIYRAGGERRHQGVELEAAGLLTPSLTVMAGISYLDAKITADADPAFIGSRETHLPRQTASVFAVKGFDGGMLKGFNAGGGIRYVGSELTTHDDSTRRIAAYTVVDLLAGYKSRNWSVQLNLNNIFDKDYVQGSNYQLVLADTYTFGEPRNVRLRVTREFGGAR